MVRLARKYSPGKIRDKIIVADGFDYVTTTKKKYDIIILDAYEQRRTHTQPVLQRRIHQERVRGPEG